MRVNGCGLRPTLWRWLAGLAALMLHALPAVAAGDATFADRQMVLTLFADQSFRLRTHEPDAYDLGRWGRDADGSWWLRGGRESPLRLRPTDDGGLHLLDASGQPVRELQRQAEVDRLNGPMRLRGMVVHRADVASLDECLTGRRWPVLAEGAHLDLERAYLAQGEGGRWMLATIEGRFVMHRPEPGLPPREAIVVERFDRLWPRETCAADAPGTASLVNTRWRLVEIDGQPVTVAEGRREPWLQLSADGNRARGFGGCNHLSGRFEQGSDGFMLKRLASTRTACPGVAGQQEARYVEALRTIASRRVAGDALKLSDAQGRVRLRFEALYLR